MRKEPALFIGLIVALLHVLLRALEIDGVDEESVQAVASFLVILGGALLTRAKVMPVATIKDAGLSPDGVKRQADQQQMEALRPPPPPPPHTDTAYRPGRRE
jgi:flagellar motor component MotA